MLLFHGTSADDATLESIFTHGLQATRHHWAGEVTPTDEHVFLSTRPVAGKGGDPVSFARGWPSRGRRELAPPGYIFVVDVPESARSHVVAAVRNQELERFWRMRAFVATLVSPIYIRGARVDGTHLEMLHELLGQRSARALRQGMRVMLLDSTRLSCDTAPTVARLCGFRVDYGAADTPARKRAVERRYGIRVPDSFRDDGHNPFCGLCIGALFSWGYGFEGQPHYAFPGHLDGRDLDSREMGGYLELLERWLAAQPRRRLAAALRRPGQWHELLSRLPPPRDSVPRTLWPDFATGAHSAALLTEPDVQVLCKPVPPGWLRGAIRVTDGGRIRAELRPDRAAGTTLEGNLWRMVHGLRRARGARALVV